MQIPINLAAKVELFKRKEFNKICIGENNKFRFSAKQVEALKFLSDNKTEMIGYGGAAFGGKTYLECYYLMLSALAYNDTAYGFGRGDLITLKKTSLVTLFKVFNENNLKNDKHFHYNQVENKITFFNDSVIYLLNMSYAPSDPLFTKFGGLELTTAVVDESNETTDMAITTLFTRTGRKNNARYNLSQKLLQCFNPAKNHVYTTFIEPTNGVLPDHVKFIPALPKDNPSPETESYINAILRNADKITIERLIFGNFKYDNDPAVLIRYDFIVNLFTNSFITESKKISDRYISADIALQGADSFVIVVWFGWVVKKIISIPKSNGKEVENILLNTAKEFKIPQSNIVFDAAGLGGFLKGYLQNGYAFLSQNKPIAMPNKAEQYADKRSQCIFLFAEKVNNSEIFIEDSTYKNEIIAELQLLKRDNIDKDGKLKAIPKEKIKSYLGGKSPDFADALYMRMIFELIN